jgi:HSP20 family molecular chaperone IbpA
MSKGTVVKKAAPTPRENVRPAPAVKSSSSAPSASAPGHAAVASAPGHAAVAFTESADAITLALDLPGREKKDVDIAIIDGGRFLELKTPAVPAAGGRRARPAVHARVALPETDRLDFAATAARMAAGELVVRIPKLPPPPPPQTWRVPVMSSEEDGEGERRAEPATTTPPKPDAAVPASAPASDDDEDGSWVEASSDDDEDKDGGKAARRKSKKGAPVSGAVLEAVDDE